MIMMILLILIACADARRGMPRRWVAADPSLRSPSQPSTVAQALDVKLRTLYSGLAQVGGPFPSWNRSMMTEIYLCHA
eukprot:COSAG01_NODE_10_length_42970_cov_93.010007_25_plen_78_part_00